MAQRITTMRKKKGTGTMPETWKPIPGWEGYYEVSDHGRVRSVPRIIQTRTGPQELKGKVISPAKYKGYPRVNLYRSGSGSTQWVHRLVLLAFYGPPSPGEEACHWDDNPENNRVENLRWGSRSDNTLDKVRNGNHFNAVKTHCSNGHEFNEMNTKITKRGKRACISCNRAHAWKSRHPELASQFQSIADSYYETLSAA